MKQPSTGARRERRTGALPRDRFLELIGTEVVRFREESTAFDDVAAQILALDRGDLACMTMLLFGGPAPVGQLKAALHVQRSAMTATIERLQLAGYARRRPEGPGSQGARIELTEHARQWIERIRRLGTPEDVAQAALFLASDQSSWISGIVVDVAGGVAGYTFS
jgi:DNA-binding MarR family transcriptional regulator